MLKELLVTAQFYLFYRNCFQRIMHHHFNQTFLIKFHKVFWIFLIFFFPGIWAVATEKPVTESKETKKIHIKADKLISDKNAQFFEFIGNVTAKQENTIVTSDNLKVFYNNDLQQTDTIAANEESIKEIIATGNVKIRFDNRVAVTEQAVYNTEYRTLILTGKDSRVMTEESWITGEKITVNRDNGHITFERGKAGPVEAIIQAGENGLK